MKKLRKGSVTSLLFVLIFFVSLLFNLSLSLSHPVFYLSLYFVHYIQVFLFRFITKLTRAYLFAFLLQNMLASLSHILTMGHLV